MLLRRADSRAAGPADEAGGEQAARARAGECRTQVRAGACRVRAHVALLYSVLSVYSIENY